MRLKRSKRRDSSRYFATSIGRWQGVGGQNPITSPLARLRRGRLPRSAGVQFGSAAGGLAGSRVCPVPGRGQDRTGSRRERAPLAHSGFSVDQSVFLISFGYAPSDQFPSCQPGAVLTSSWPADSSSRMASARAVLLFDDPVRRSQGVCRRNPSDAGTSEEPPTDRLLGHGRATASHYPDGGICRPPRIVSRRVV